MQYFLSIIMISLQLIIKNFLGHPVVPIRYKMPNLVKILSFFNAASSTEKLTTSSCFVD